MAFSPFDKSSSQLAVGGAQPSSLGFAFILSGTDLSAGYTITISASKPIFKAPTGSFSVKTYISNGLGANCKVDFTTGTTLSTTWTLSPLNGACMIPSSNQFQFFIPQDFAAVSPAAGQITVYGITTGTTRVAIYFTYQSYATIYVTANPRNADNSDSFLVGGARPSFLNIGWTNTWDVLSGAIIQISSSTAVLWRPATAYTIPITGTGCTATLITIGTPAAASGFNFTLSGTSCKLSQNVPVADSQFQLPGSLLAVNPVDTTVSITVTFFTLAPTGGFVANAVKNGNPGSYTTTNNCSAWSAWSSCTAKCGTGSVYRTRTGPLSSCVTTVSSRACNTISCGCAPWSAWGTCSATCNGTISRARVGSDSTCNVPTVDVQSCGPSNCSAPWTQTNCSSSCGSGVRTRTVTLPKCTSPAKCTVAYDVVCNETFTTESLSCPCLDTPWTDRFGSTCNDYVKQNWCTIDGGYGLGWNFSLPGFRSFDYRTNNGQNALSACCGCGKNKCVKDTVLLIDQSSSIAVSDWGKMKQYITDRINQTAFTNQYGNRIGVVQFDVAASVLCPLTWNQTFLLNCVKGITFPAGSGTATSAGLDLTYAVLDSFSSRNRTRVVEMLTDGSPNIPQNNAEAAAFASAYRLKDDGVTIVTIGMGIACTSALAIDCLNKDVLSTIASEPTPSYAVLLASYDSLSAMSLFISSQCTAQLAGFDPSPSPIPVFSPEASISPLTSTSPVASASPAASTSPWATASPLQSPIPSPSPFPSPSPDAHALCVAQEAVTPSDWLVQDVQGCGRTAVASLLRQYQCVELQPSCGTFQCLSYVPPNAILQIQTSCNFISS